MKAWNLPASLCLYWQSTAAGLTHRAFSGDGHGLQQDLDDAGADAGRAFVVGVQMVEDLLDDVVRVLSLHDTDRRSTTTGRFIPKQLQTFFLDQNGSERSCEVIGDRGALERTLEKQNLM